VVGGQEVDGRAPGQDLDVPGLADVFHQAFHDGLAGVVRGEQDARFGMAALAGQIPGAGVLLGKGDVVLVDEDILKHARAFVAQEAYGLQEILVPARGEDVLFQSPGIVLGAVEDDAALGQPGVAGEQGLPGSEQGHVQAGFGQGQGGHRPGDARADDQDVGFQAEVVHGGSSLRIRRRR
jgi:hypothetical protein